MAQDSYLTTAFWKCHGPFFNFIHEESTPLGSCMVVGKVSTHRSYLAPYGDFNINEHDACEMRRSKFLFTLVRPDNCSGAFQTDFDACIYTVHSIVDNFRGFKTAQPFITTGPEGPSFTFSHEVFEHVCLIRLASVYKCN